MLTVAVRLWDAAVRNRWELVRDPAPPGMPTCRAPCSPAVTLTPAASSSLPRASLTPSLKPGLLEQLFHGKCRFLRLDRLRRDMAGTSMVSSRFLGPQFPPSAWNHILELPSFPSLPNLPGWKWTRKAGSLEGLAKLVALPFLGSGPTC